MTFREYLKKHPHGDIARAAAVAERAHRGQKRMTGEPYFIHPFAVAETLYGWNLDETTIVAGFLHDTIEDTEYSREDLKKDFGQATLFLVEGVTKLGKIKYRGEEESVQAENLRKMIIALSEDLRVIFIKLADRLHNMKTLSALPHSKQKRIALETDEIYAPLAYRLGMQSLSGELQDLAFPYLHPRDFEWLKEKVADAYESRMKYLLKISPSLQETIKNHGIKNAEIQFRAKRWSSLFNKLTKNNVGLDSIYDLIALRVLVDSVEECYTALGIVHGLWAPLPGKIKDYIAMPKPNGYKSLHTTVIGPEEKIMEVQIRTRAMHEENENGVAAHWLYKQRHKVKKNLKEELKWVAQLRAWQENYEGSGAKFKDFVESLKIEFFKTRIFVITPKGKVLDLPAGSTPVDFAYHIHTTIGDSCVAAKVNGEIVPLHHELRSGDLVEILTQNNKHPSEGWLKFIKSSMARTHIKEGLRKQRSSLRHKKI